MRRLWIVPLIVSMIVPVLLHEPVTYWTLEYAAFDSVLYSLIGLVALFFGATAFAGELAMGVQDFLFSRPVSWKKVLAAKLIVGLGMITFAALAGAVVFRLTCPAPYLPFLTLSHMAVGVVWTAAFASIPYLIGAACSVVLPGTIGAVMTVLASAIAFGVVITVLKEAGWRYGEPGFMIPWYAGELVAAVFVVRFGLTLSLAQRVKRYAAAWLIAAACLTPAAVAMYTAPRTPESRLLSDYQFSPDRSHALVLTSLMNYAQSSPTGLEAHFYYWDISNNRMSKITLQDGTRPTWVNNDTLAWYRVKRERRGNATVVTGGEVSASRMDGSGQLITRHLRLPLKTRPQFNLVSPDGRLVALADRGPDGFFEAYEFLDLNTMKLLSTCLIAHHPTEEHWQNNTQFSVTDDTGTRHTVTVK